MSWKRYPEYKESGIEWLGEMPEHWKLEPLKRTFKIINGSTPKSGELSYWDGDIAWATPDDLGSLKGDTLHITQRSITQAGYESCGTSLAPTGSLVLSTRAPIGHLALSGVSMCTNQGCRCLTFCNKDNHKFYYYQLLSAKHELKSWGQGSTFKELSRDKLSYACLVKAPVVEQNAIAAFLDRETERIDTLVTQKERQIELLQEKRVALISHAVTKGLNPDVKMKDSGIEWLGNVPVGWRVERLRFNVWTNPTKAEVKNITGDTLVSFVPMEAVCEYGGLSLDQTKPLDELSNGYTYFRNGDVLVAKITPCFENGKGSIAEGLENGIGFGTTELHVLRPQWKIDYKYLFYLTISYAFRQIGKSYMYGAGGQKRVPDDFIRNLRHSFPVISEQRTIASFLDCETERIDTLIKKVQESIDKLHKYRTALISAAVTGKIDVRKEVA